MKQTLENLLDAPVLEHRALTGGDISEVHWVQTLERELVIKINRDQKLPDLLAAERKGLRMLTDTETIAIPKVHNYRKDDAGEYLVMDYIEQRAARPEDHIRLAEQLAALHTKGTPFCGADTGNYIGRLRQANTPTNLWSDFYARLRLLPQLYLAKQRGYLSQLPGEGRVERVCTELLGNPTPSPLHGDLWGGNYIIAADGTPFLIDPSCYYGHREVDLAMSRLFGGFDAEFYRAYDDLLPAEVGVEVRQDLYQLYYLLVHLNMFGPSCQGAVTRILERYFL